MSEYSVNTIAFPALLNVVECANVYAYEVGVLTIVPLIFEFQRLAGLGLIEIIDHSARLYLAAHD